MDSLDLQIVELLKVNARLPVVKIAKALGVARSTVQLRLKALEDSGAITGYTVSLGQRTAGRGIRAFVMVQVESHSEGDVVRTLSRRHEVAKLWTVSGRYDLTAMVQSDSMEEIEKVIDRVRTVKGVTDTMTIMVLSTKVDRPD
jgi:DNA-binding Lrp family transcriptional regulator